MSSVDAMIERMAAEALAEIRRMADHARIALGWSISKCNRSRAQKARWQKARGLTGGSK